MLVSLLVCALRVKLFVAVWFCLFVLTCLFYCLFTVWFGILIAGV